MAARSDVRQLLLQVDANVELARRALDGLDRDIGRDTASIDRSLGRIDQAMGRVAVAAGAFVSIRGFASLGQQFLGLADQSKQMQAQLQLATAQLGSFGQAQKDVESIADATRAGLGETANLYGNFIRAAAESGRTQSDAARATQSFAQALKIGGASADEARSATLQFGQALASGVLRGDEFNSIMEASPRIARLLADSLGVPIGQLRKLAEEGKLTREVLFNALLDGNLTKGLQGEFDRLPITVADAMTKVENAAISTFGAFDRGGEFSTAIANFVSDGASDFKTLAGEAEDLGRDIRGTIAGLANVWDGFEDAGVAAMRTIKQEYGPLLRVVEGYIERAKFANKIAGYLNLPGAVAGVILNNPLIKDRFTAGRDTYVEDSLRRSVLSDIWAEGIPKFPSESGGGNSSTGGGGGARRASTRARKLTDADLSPMQLILRDIGKEGLPIDAGYQKELTALTSMGDALDSIGTDAERIAQYEGAVGKLLSEADQDRLEQFSQYFSEDLAAGIADAVVYADSLGDALENSFKRAAAALLESGILELISPGGSGGSLFRGFLSNAAGLFGGFRASGGPVSPGRAYVVGEKRPELFVPNVPGMIVPSADMMGAAGTSSHVTQHFSINAQGAVLAQGLIAEMQAIGVRAAGGGAVIAEQRANQRARNTLR